MQSIPNGIVTGRGGLVAYVGAADLFDCYLEQLTGGVVKPLTAQEALAQSGARAVLDGPMFKIVGEGGYASARAFRLDYRVQSEVGTEDGGDATNARGITLSIVEGVAIVRGGDDPHPAARVAVQLYPTLVRNGKTVASRELNREHTWRAGVAVLSDGRIALAVAPGTMRGFAGALREQLGAVDAGYGDGGGSTRLLLDDGRVFGSRENRRVASWLLLR